METCARMAGDELVIERVGSTRETSWNEGEVPVVDNLWSSAQD